MSAEDLQCVYCGSKEDLVEDENLEEIWICGACLARRDAHQSAIDYGFDDEEPAVE